MSKITDRLTLVSKTLDKKNLAKEGHAVFKSITPKRSGNAQSNTLLNGSTINADYEYALRLNTGWSKQAPNGMTDPTIDAIRKYINSTLK